MYVHVYTIVIKQDTYLIQGSIKNAFLSNVNSSVCYLPVTIYAELKNTSLKFRWLYHNMYTMI